MTGAADAVAAASVALPTVRTASGWYNFGAQVATVLSIFAGIAIAWIKIGPKWKEAALGERRFDFAEMRKLIDEAKAEASDACRRARVAEEHMHVVQMQMVQMNAGFHLVAGELQKNDPDNPVLKQARELVAMAARSDFGFSDDITRLGRIAAARIDEAAKPAG